MVVNVRARATNGREIHIVDVVECSQQHRAMPIRIDFIAPNKVTGVRLSVGGWKKKERNG